MHKIMNALTYYLWRMMVNLIHECCQQYQVQLSQGFERSSKKFIYTLEAKLSETDE